MNANGKKLSVDDVEVILYSDELPDTIMFDRSYCLDQIFNKVETGLNYKMLPNKILEVKVDREAPGAKKCKECVTILMYYLLENW